MKRMVKASYYKYDDDISNIPNNIDNWEYITDSMETSEECYWSTEVNGIDSEGDDFDYSFQIFKIDGQYIPMVDFEEINWPSKSFNTSTDAIKNLKSYLVDQLGWFDSVKFGKQHYKTNDRGGYMLD